MDALDVAKLAELGQEQELEFIVLFGSRARKTEQPSSDIDLAIMPSREMPDDTSWQIVNSLVERLARADLDPVWLPTASWLLAWEVARDGRVLYEREAGAFHKYWLATALRRAEAEPWRRRDSHFLDRVIKQDRTLHTDLVRRYLSLLGQYLEELEQVLTSDRQHFVDDFRVHRLAERQLELLVEAAAAINTEVSQAVAGIPPSDYYSSFFSLSQAGWITPATARALASVAGLRNRLVHQYEDVNQERLYDAAVGCIPHWRTYLSSARARLHDQ